MDRSWSSQVINLSHFAWVFSTSQPTIQPLPFEMTAFPPRQSLLDSFLTEIVTSLRSKNGVRISELIQLDFEGLSTERQQPYADLNGELNSNYARGNDAELVQQCKRAIAQHEFGSFATAFSESILLYFRYLRDFTTADNQAKASEIRQLTRCVLGCSVENQC